MIVAGGFNVCGRANATLFARYNGTDWSALGGALGDAVGKSGPGVGPYGMAFAFVGSRVVVGGAFSRTVAGTWLNNIGYMTDINSASWLAMGRGGQAFAGLNAAVFGIAPQGDDVALICGRFWGDNSGVCFNALWAANHIIKFNFTAGNWSCFGGDGFDDDVLRESPSSSTTARFTRRGILRRTGKPPPRSATLPATATPRACGRPCVTV